MEPLPVHKALKPLEFLIGKWHSISGSGEFPPRVQPFEYHEELSFESVGQPNLIYTATSWHAVKKSPMHLERGFLKIKPGSNDVSLVVAHNFGLVTIEEGVVDDGVMMLKGMHIARSSFNKDPAVTALERNFKLDGDKLQVVTNMATSLDADVKQHLIVTYKKSDSVLPVVRT